MLSGEIALKNNHYYYYVLIRIMHNAFNLLVFPSAMFTPLLFLFIERAMCSPEKLHLEITIIIIMPFTIIKTSIRSACSLRKQKIGSTKSFFII